jgi:hypothetical protein
MVMDFVDAMHVYFRGEKQIGLFLVPFGLALLGFALYFVRTQSGGFMWGLVIPLALVGVGAAAGGAGLALRTDRQVAALEQKYREAPRALAAEETPRMARVNRNWPILKATWAVVILLSLALLFFVKRDWVTGLSLVLLLVCASVMMIDTFAERRARVYTEHLEVLARTTAGGAT